MGERKGSALGKDGYGRGFTTGTQVWHERAPRVDDALGKATPVTVKLNDPGESEVRAVVCDSAPWGVLLDLHEGSNSERGGYKFIPWTSVKHVVVPSDVEHRQTGFGD